MQRFADPEDVGLDVGAVALFCGGDGIGVED